MSNATERLYEKGSVNYKRLLTDTLFSDYGIECRHEGIIGEGEKFIENAQLLDPVLWKRFVNLFRLRPDSKTDAWSGEYWGKMMRGASLLYTCTRNEKLYDILRDTVIDMLSTEDELGRISTFETDREFHGWDIWCRKYVLLGMQYYLEINRDAELEERVVASMMRQADYLISKLGPASEGKIPINKATNNWRGLNSSSVLEPIVRLYDLTSEQRYLDFARYIVNEGGTEVYSIFELAYEDITDPYQYPMVKAYELMSCFEGLLEYYRATGETKWRDAVVRFSRRLMNTDITIIGCAGCTHELLDHSAVRQTDPTYKGHMQETCVTVTWMKLCWQMLCLTGDPIYADRYEQSLYNAYLGTLNTNGIVNPQRPLSRDPEAIPEAMPFDSYSPLLPGVRGKLIGGLQIMPDKHYYGCCACIGSAGMGLVSKVGVMLNNDGIAVNLYIPGAVITKTPSGNALTVNTKTEYPANGKIVMTVGLDKEESFEISVRIPEWSLASVLRVNGEKINAAVGYTVIDRVWKNGDEIELELDMRTKVIKPIPNPRDILMTHIPYIQKTDVSGGEYAVPRVVIESPEAKNHIALRRGPLTLARDARFGKDIEEGVQILYDADGFVAVNTSSTADFDRIVELDVPLVNGGSFKVIDYSSAGKTWDENSKCACWLPTSDYRKNS